MLVSCRNQRFIFWAQKRKTDQTKKTRSSFQVDSLWSQLSLVVCSGSLALKVDRDSWFNLPPEERLQVTGRPLCPATGGHGTVCTLLLQPFLSAQLPWASKSKLCAEAWYGWNFSLLGSVLLPTCQPAAQSSPLARRPATEIQTSGADWQARDFLLARSSRFSAIVNWLGQGEKLGTAGVRDCSSQLDTQASPSSSQLGSPSCQWPEHRQLPFFLNSPSNCEVKCLKKVSLNRQWLSPSLILPVFCFLR